MGNLLIGEQARNHFVEMPSPVAVDRPTAYPALALAVSSGEVPGSSAGGEQPKFCTYTERGHVIVKFTAPDDNPISERWRDLLLAEHVALKVLGVETEVFDFGGQRFLEIPRFDRTGALGRNGLFSLRALEAEFVGRARETWPVLVNELVKQGCVHLDAVAATARLWAFGMLIGNTDMHHGNLSFISAHGRPYHLAPAYDMLPMGFAPKSGGGMVNTLRPASLPEVIEGDTRTRRWNWLSVFMLWPAIATVSLPVLRHAWWRYAHILTTRGEDSAPGMMRIRRDAFYGLRKISQKVWRPSVSILHLT